MLDKVVNSPLGEVFSFFKVGIKFSKKLPYTK